MSTPPITYDIANDLIDRLVGLHPGSTTYDVRHRRDKVAAATQGSYDALFDPTLSDTPLAERLLVALYACRLTPAPELAAHYRQALLDANVDSALIRIAEQGSASEFADPRLAAIFEFTRKLIEKPVEGDRARCKPCPKPASALRPLSPYRNSLLFCPTKFAWSPA